MTRWTPFLAVLALSACLPQTGMEPQTGTEPQPDRAACPVLSSSDWAAWVNLMPGAVPAAGPAPARVIVTGSVVLAPGAPAVDLIDAGPDAASRVPTRQLRLVPSPAAPVPAGPVHLRLEFPAQRAARGSAPWGAVRITCEGRDLALLTVDEAH